MAELDAECDEILFTIPVDSGEHKGEWERRLKLLGAIRSRYHSALFKELAVIQPDPAIYPKRINDVPSGLVLITRNKPVKILKKDQVISDYFDFIYKKYYIEAHIDETDKMEYDLLILEIYKEVREALSGDVELVLLGTDQ